MDKSSAKKALRQLFEDERPLGELLDEIVDGLEEPLHVAKIQLNEEWVVVLHKAGVERLLVEPSADSTGILRRVSRPPLHGLEIEERSRFIRVPELRQADDDPVRWPHSLTISHEDLGGEITIRTRGWDETTLRALVDLLRSWARKRPAIP